MTSRADLENYAIFLQKMAHMIVSTPTMKRATLSKLVGEAGLFDRDLTTVLSVLYAHDNLSGEGVPDADKPITLIKALQELLSNSGFYFPSLSRRMRHIETATNGSFSNPSSEYGGGEADALDRPLRAIGEKLHEIRMYGLQSGDEKKKKSTEKEGAHAFNLLDKLIGTIKAMETEGSGYNVSDSHSRATSGRTDFLDARYDELSGKINDQVGTSSSGEKIELFHLNVPSMHKELGLKSYAVSEASYSLITEVTTVLFGEDYKIPENFYPIKKLLPPPPLGSQSDSARDERQEEMWALRRISRRDSLGKRVVRVITLPFSPDQVDDNFPTLDLYSDDYIGPSVSRTVLESINAMRFSGYVDFDDKYRMMIMWATAGDDSKKGNRGGTYKDLLFHSLKDSKNSFTKAFGVEPTLTRTKRGAAYYWPKAINLGSLVDNFYTIVSLIKSINSSIAKKEEARKLTRSFNKEINDDELPGYMEESL